MNTFDRYILREWLYILGLVLAATCGLLVVQVLYDDFRDVRELGGRGLVLWKYVGVKIPSFLAIVLPMAVLVSLLYALGKLHRANELTAMRAAGVSILRITAPIWAVGVLTCGLSWWLNTTVVPWSIEESRTILEGLAFRHETNSALPPDRRLAVGSVAFDNTPERRMWFLNRFSRYTNRGYGVSVSELDSQRRELRRHIAAEAWRDNKTGGWVFVRGRTLSFAPETAEMTGSKPFERLEAPTYREDPELMLLIDRKPSDLSLHELRELIAYLEREGSPNLVKYAVRYYSLIANTLAPLIVIAIAIPFAVAGVRVNPAVGVSKSIGLFVVYYIFSNTSSALAVRSIVSPEVAAWMPSVGMTALAAWFFSRMR